jgi:CheY-like chemotaxis protein
MNSLKRILLVEDSANDIALILEAFREINLANEVMVARDGQEALDLLYRTSEGSRPREPDLPILILLDIKLPKLDGLEVLARIKNDPVLRLLPVVILSSSREESDLLRCYGLGVNAYVVKPVSFIEFVAALKDLGVFWAVTNQPPPNLVRSAGC